MPISWAVQKNRFQIEKKCVPACFAAGSTAACSDTSFTRCACYPFLGLLCKALRCCRYCCNQYACNCDMANTASDRKV